MEGKNSASLHLFVFVYRRNVNFSDSLNNLKKLDYLSEHFSRITTWQKNFNLLEVKKNTCSVIRPYNQWTSERFSINKNWITQHWKGEKGNEVR